MAPRKTTLLREPGLLHKSRVSHPPARGRTREGGGRGALWDGRVDGRVEWCKNTAVGSSLTALQQQPAGRGARMSPLLPIQEAFQTTSSLEKTAGSSLPTANRSPFAPCSCVLGKQTSGPLKRRSSVSFFAPPWPCAMSFWGPQAEMPIMGTQLLSYLLAHHYCFISSLPFLLPNTPSSTQATGDKTISFPIPTPWRQSPGFL